MAMQSIVFLTQLLVSSLNLLNHLRTEAILSQGVLSKASQEGSMNLRELEGIKEESESCTFLRVATGLSKALMDMMGMIKE